MVKMKHLMDEITIQNIMQFRIVLRQRKCFEICKLLIKAIMNKKVVSEII